jgi:hypothetical protein
MKSRIPIFLAILCAILAAPLCPAQNATPTPAAAAPSPPSDPSSRIYFDTNTDNFNFNALYKPGLTLSQFVKSLPKDIQWTTNSKLSLHHQSDPPTIIEVSVIEKGQLPDIPLLPNDRIIAEPKPFIFQGGTPSDVIKQAQDYFGVDWSMTVIPPDMQNIRVMPFRITYPSGPGDVLNLYDKLSGQVSPPLGQWFLEGDAYKPDILMLSSNGQTIPQAKAIAIADIPKDKWNQIQNNIRQADRASQEFANAPQYQDSGNLLFQDDSKILVVIGPPSFIELAESVVAAYRENARIADLEAAGYKPSENPPPSPPK